jgi:UDP-glucose 4-epimerase
VIHFVGARVLVTGGLGFIGSNLVHLLSRESDAQVTVLDSLGEGMGGNRRSLDGVARAPRVTVADMADRDATAAIVRGQDYIFNLAGHVSHTAAMDAPLRDAHSNYCAHVTLLESCRRANRHARIVFASTRQVYGRARSLPMSEDHPLDPIDVNGTHKLAAERLHAHYHRVHGIRTVTLRLTNTYGPRQLIRNGQQGFIAWFIRRALDGDELEVFGDGQDLRGMVHVDDATRALCAAASLDVPPGTVFNIDGERAYTIERLAQMVTTAAGGGRYRKIAMPPAWQAIHVGSAVLDATRFRTATEWGERVALEDGLRRTLAFYRRERVHYV